MPEPEKPKSFGKKVNRWSFRLRRCPVKVGAPRRNAKWRFDWFGSQSGQSQESLSDAESGSNDAAERKVSSFAEHDGTVDRENTAAPPSAHYG